MSGSDPVEEMVRAELQAYERTGELVPGAADALLVTMKAGLHAGTSTGTADHVAEHVAKRLELPANARYRNPEHAAPTAPNGGEASPLRRVLNRYADRLAPGAVDTLATQWAADTARLTKPGQLEAEVTRRLADWRNNPHLAVAHKHEAPPHVARLSAMLDLHFGDRPEGDRLKVGRALEKEALRSSGDQRHLIKMAAHQLGLPRDDPRHRGQTADGSLVTPDGKVVARGQANAASRPTDRSRM